MLIPVDIRLRLDPNNKADTIANERLLPIGQLREAIRKHYPHYSSRMFAYSNSGGMDQVTIALASECRKDPDILKVWESLGG